MVPTQKGLDFWGTFSKMKKPAARHSKVMSMLQCKVGAPWAHNIDLCGVGSTKVYYHGTDLKSDWIYDYLQLMHKMQAYAQGAIDYLKEDWRGNWYRVSADTYGQYIDTNIGLYQKTDINYDTGMKGDLQKCTTYRIRRL